MASPTLTNVLVAAASHDLVSLDDVKDELQIGAEDASKDGFLARAIAQTSAAIENYCNRAFPIETIQDVYDELSGGIAQSYRLWGYPPYRHFGRPTATEILKLSRHPIASQALTLSVTGDTAAGNTIPVASTVGLAIGYPVGHLSIPDGTTITAFDAVSITLSAALTAPVAVLDTITAGITVNVTDRDSADTSREVITLDQFIIDFDAGELIWRELRHRLAITSVCYVSGYAAIPADLQEAALRAITARNAARGRDPMLRELDQPAAGHQQFWVGTAPGQRGGFTGEIADLLDAYKEF